MKSNVTLSAGGPLLKRIGQSVRGGSNRAGTSGDPGKYLPKTMVFHFRPRSVPEEAVRFTHTWGLGGMAFVLIMLLFGTGLLLKLVYKPFPDMAYDSILMIQHEIRFGLWVRNVHHWSANILVIILFLHMQRVFFTGGFHHPRQFNWVIGMVLFLLILASNFTGYLLPWDQLAYWAITISTGMLDYVPFFGGWLQAVIRGGTEIGPASLLLFFAVHTAVLPAGICMVGLFHFWRIRKAGGVVVPLVSDEEKAERRRTPVFPDLLLRELVVALVVVAFVLIFSAFINAPLDMKANPGLSPNPAKAPWFFIGLQELLLHVHPVFSVLVIPVLLLGGLLLVPYINYASNRGGIWFYSENGRRMGIYAVAAAVFFTAAGILGDAFFFDFTTALPMLPPVVGSGLLPVISFTGAAAVFLMALKRRFSADSNEAVQSLYIFLMVMYVVLTITCLWFRGTDMALVWPWG